MPFDNTATARLLDDEAKVKYDLTTGKGRLAYLADQLEARRPHDFDMRDWAHCAIGEGRKMDALVALGLPRCGVVPISDFFGLSVETTSTLFAGFYRTVDQEVAVIRAHIHHAT